MRAVFDTNIIIDYLNGITLAKEEIEEYEEKAISIITYIEVLVGIKENKMSNTVKAFLRNFSMLAVSENIANLAIVARKQYKLKVPDAIVLATAQDFNGALITRNTKDFTNKMPLVKIPYKLGN